MEKENQFLMLLDTKGAVVATDLHGSALRALVLIAILLQFSTPTNQP